MSAKVDVAPAAEQAEVKQGITLLIVDPQNDFHEGGSLAVPGANADAERVAKLIKEKGDIIDDIIVTMDSHHPLHIAHSCFWVNAEGKNPDPFTLLSKEDVEAGKWKTAMPEFEQWGKDYTTKLEASGKFKLCIWPEHCRVGSKGHNVVDVIQKELEDWGRRRFRHVHYVHKGENFRTEMYSVIKAEVPLADDPSTQENKVLLERLQKGSKVVICGQALSHCVNYTARDVAAAWPKERIADLVLLTDGASNVAGFEAAGKQFVEDVEKLGVTLSSVDNFIANN